MASKSEIIQWILEQLRPLDVEARAMFGEYGLYCSGIFVGVICNNTLFLKRNTATDDLLGVDNLAPPYVGARDHHLVSNEMIDGDCVTVRNAVSGAAKVLPSPRKRR